jgi:hypothetical protein
MVGVGLALAAAAYATVWALLGEHPVLSEMVTKAPPWILLSSIAAAPPVILTWYWRTIHKDIDIRQAARDHAAKVASNQTARDTHLLDVYMRAVEALTSTELSKQLAGLALLAQVGRESDHYRGSVLLTMSTYLQEKARTPPPAGYNRDQASPRDVIEAFKLFASIPKSETQTAELGWISLNGFTIDKGDFRYVKFTDVTLDRVKLVDCDFRGARFERLNSAWFTADRCDFRNSHFVSLYLSGYVAKGCDFAGAQLMEGNVDMPVETTDDGKLVPNDWLAGALKGAFIARKVALTTPVPNLKPEQVGAVVLDA